MILWTQWQYLPRHLLKRILWRSQMLCKRMARSHNSRKNLRNHPNLDWHLWSLLFVWLTSLEILRCSSLTNGQAQPTPLPSFLLCYFSLLLILSLSLCLSFSPSCFTTWHVLPVLISLKYSEVLIKSYHWSQ